MYLKKNLNYKTIHFILVYCTPDSANASLRPALSVSRVEKV